MWVKSMKKICFIFGIMFFWGIVIGNVKFEVNASDKQKVEDAKNGIVKIESGVKDSNGIFYQIKGTSGFVVANENNEVYIVTTDNVKSFSKEEKKKAKQNNKIKEKIDTLDLVLRVVIDGDVTTEVSIVAESKEENYLILKSNDVINEKKALHIGNIDELSVGDNIYALSYPVSGEKLKYSSEEVEIHGGQVQDTNAMFKNKKYIQHSAVLLSEQVGGVLISDDGYVIGLIDATKTRSEINACYAETLDSLITVLDNYGILYESKKKDDALKKLRSYYEKIQEDCQSGSYKKNTVVLLNETLKQVSEKIEQEELNYDEILLLQKELEQANSKLEKKTPKVQIVEYIMGVLIFILVLRLVIVFIQYKKMINKKQMTAKNEDISVNKNQIIENKIKSKDLIDHTSDEKEMDSSLVDSDEGTVILGKNENIYQRKKMQFDFKTKAYLHREKDDTVFYINKNTTSIGKSEQKADIIITGNNAISRVHAEIISTGDDNYSIRDLKSANGTFVNGKNVYEDEVKLSDGDLVVLADEKFKFYIRG